MFSLFLMKSCALVYTDHFILSYGGLLMSVGDYRFRTRTIPYLGSQQFKLGYQDPVIKTGKWELKSVDTGLWVPMGDTLFQTQTPFSKAESVMDEIHKRTFGGSSGARGRWKTGGPFTKISIEFPPEEVKGIGRYDSGSVTRAIYGVGTGPIRYTGGFGIPIFQGDDTSYANLSQLLGYTSPLIPPLTDWSAKAYEKTRPSLEKAGFAVFAAEARDIPRMLSTSAGAFHDAWRGVGGIARSDWSMQPRSAANHFLNHEFGWVPFINDIQKFNYVYQNAAYIRSRLTSENNRWIHRRATLLDDYTERKISSDTGMRVSPAGDYIGTLFDDTAHWEVWERKASLITTSGVFRYYRPEFDASLPDYSSAWNTVQRQLTMYGARINPSNVYKAIPWTWLIDWFTDFGSVIDRAQDLALDSIAAQYLFLMRHDTREVVLKQYLPFKTGGHKIIEFSRLTDVKIRRESDSPYGFGLAWNGLSPKQLAILGALGISRRRIV
jgi:hypothetical protein